MQFIELPSFKRNRERLLSEQEYRNLQNALISDDLRIARIPGGGGVMKARWSSRGKGKRSGLRIIFYVVKLRKCWYLFDIFYKGQREDLTKSELKILARAIQKIEDY